ERVERRQLVRLDDGEVRVLRGGREAAAGMEAQVRAGLAGGERGRKPERGVLVEQRERERARGRLELRRRFAQRVYARDTTGPRQRLERGTEHLLARKRRRIETRAQVGEIYVPASRARVKNSTRVACALRCMRAASASRRV